tara:strand:- start:194 stop:457 length:264 start_codon:yes stop_codon:yes gene_type:complete
LLTVLLFDIVDWKEKRRRRRSAVGQTTIETDNAEAFFYDDLSFVLVSLRVGLNGTTIPLNLKMPCDVGIETQPESLILAQNERWRQA